MVDFISSKGNLSFLVHPLWAEVLGTLANFLVPEALDYHRRKVPPGPTCPLIWVTSFPIPPPPNLDKSLPVTSY